MKVLTFLFLCMLASSFTQAQWVNQNPVPNGNDLWKVFFVDDNTGWIVGSEGFIKKTTNAGLDWIQQNSVTTLTLRSIQFINQNTGWICGEGGLILKTTDGGQIWFELKSETNEILTDLHFYDLNVGWIVGYKGTILKTIDGGSSWIIQFSDTSFNLESVDFVNADCGYAVGEDRILKTTDGGTRWIDKSTPEILYPLNTVEFIDADTGWIGGGLGGGSVTNIIYKTTDGGDVWVEQYLGFLSRPSSFHKKESLVLDDGGGIRSIFFKNSKTGYAVGGDGWGWGRSIYTTTNGGSTWIGKYYADEENGLLSLYVNSAGKGWAVGFSGAIFNTNDNGFSWLQILSGDRSSYWSGDDIYSVFFLNENIGWAAGKRGGQGEGDVILKTTNGGKIWETQFFGAGDFGPVRSIHFVDEKRGWAVSDFNGLLRTTNGGEEWMTEGNGGNASVFFINPDTGWVTNDSPAPGEAGINKSTDGGITWVQKSNISSSGIYFSDLSNGWAVGQGGSILKSTDGGETWFSQSSGTTNDLNSVSFWDSNNGVCVGNNGTILLSTDGGESWISKINGSVDNLKSVTFANATTIWVVGNNGTILRTTDSGDIWTQYNNITTNDLTSLYFLNEFTGWVGGMNGTMFKYQNNIIPVELISFAANVKDNGVELNWQTATEINNYGFEIERRSDVKGWTKIGFVKGQGNSNSPHYYSFPDNNPLEGTRFSYRLKQLDNDGGYKYSNEAEVDLLPSDFELYQNFPNPFNPTTKIRYQLPIESKVVIKIYNILGSEIATLLNEKKEAGVYEIEFNASNLASGTYIYRINAGAFTETRKMVLLR